MQDDSGKQQTKVGQIKNLIEDIHAISIDLREKATQLTITPVRTDPEKGKDIKAPAENVGNELVESLSNIRSILQEAYKTFSAFV